MVIIYAFTTPGEYLLVWPFGFAPTYEGMHGGFIQSLRLLNMLAAVSLLLHTTSRHSLMSGLLLLMSPLGFLGLNINKFTARLYLTLHYVEATGNQHGSAGFFEYINQSLMYQADEYAVQEFIELHVPAFQLIDLVTGCVLLASIWVLL